MRLAKKVAVITGGGSGIGLAIATRFAREGAHAVILERNEMAGREAAKAITQDGGSASFLHVDVSEDDQMREAFASVVARHQRLDVLVNNAGGSLVQDGPVTDVPLDIFWKTIKVDLFGTFLGCRYAIPAMQEQGGSIINISSFYAIMGSPNRDSYTAAKGGVAALTRSMAVEYAQYKIRVNAIAPGTTLTARTSSLLENVAGLDYLKGLHLLGMLSPEDHAPMAVYLASDESHRTTGQIFSVDSGLTAA